MFYLYYLQKKYKSKDIKCQKLQVIGENGFRS